MPKEWCGWELDFDIGDLAHVYIGWGEVVKYLGCGRFVLKFADNQTGEFPINQMSKV